MSLAFKTSWSTLRFLFPYCFYLIISFTCGFPFPWFKWNSIISSSALVIGSIYSFLFCLKPALSLIAVMEAWTFFVRTSIEYFVEMRLNFSYLDNVFLLISEPLQILVLKMRQRTVPLRRLSLKSTQTHHDHLKFPLIKSSYISV